MIFTLSLFINAVRDTASFATIEIKRFFSLYGIVAPSLAALSSVLRRAASLRNQAACCLSLSRYGFRFSIQLVG